MTWVIWIMGYRLWGQGVTPNTKRYSQQQLLHLKEVADMCCHPAVIPVYKIQGDRIRQNALEDVSSVASTSSFMKLTASNLGHGSGYYW